MKKLFLVMLCAILAMSMFSACTKTPVDTSTEVSTEVSESVQAPEATPEQSAGEVKEYKIAVSLPTKSSEWFAVYADMVTSAIDSMNAEGKYHIEFNIIHNDSAADQVDSVLTQIVDQPDIMLMVPVDMDTSVTAVEACFEAEIPVVTTCRQSNSEHVTAARVYNEPQFAINQLEAIAKDFPNGAKIVYLFGPNTASYAQIQYNDGFLKNLPNYPGIELIKTLEDEQDTQESGVKLADDALTMYSDEIDAFVATNDGLALGAVQAIKAAGYEGEISVYGSSALPQGMVAIREGNMSFTNMKSQAVMATQAIQLCLDVLEGKEFEEFGLVDPVPINKDNVETIKDATFGGTIADPHTFDFGAY